jgi:hypothetical protein
MYLQRTCTALLIASGIAHAAEPCRVIYGRADYYSGDGQMFIWHIGTHHNFWVLDDKSQNMIFHYIPYKPNTDSSKSLFADFTICPTTKYKPGAAQFTKVVRIERPRVVQVR